MQRETPRSSVLLCYNKYGQLQQGDSQSSERRENCVHREYELPIFGGVSHLLLSSPSLKVLRECVRQISGLIIYTHWLLRKSNSSVASHCSTAVTSSMSRASQVHHTMLKNIQRDIYVIQRRTRTPHGQNPSTMPMQELQARCLTAFRSFRE